MHCFNYSLTFSTQKNTEQVLITSVSSSDHFYLQFSFDFMILTQNFSISYFEQKSYLSESLD